jgi:hypothetical protein
MADARTCFAGDLGSWAIGRTVTGTDLDGNTRTVAVDDIQHRNSAYKDELRTIIRGMTSHGWVTVIFNPQSTVTVGTVS